MSNKSGFSPKLLIGFVVLAIGTLILGLYLATKQQDATDNLGAGTHSRSAIGHMGLASVLERLKIPVIKARGDAVAKASDGILVLAEPMTKFGHDNPMYGLMEANRILLVLPKWQGVKSKIHEGWLSHAEQKHTFQAEVALNFAAAQGNVFRVDTVDKWTTNTFNLTPQFTKPVQLMTSPLLKPLISTGKGILLGERITDDERTIWVLSDPDVLSNHGLGVDGKRNAVLAVALIQRLRGETTGPVVFDETIHGFLAHADSPWRILFEFPFSIVSVQALAAIGLLLWATMGRFGAPEKPPVPLSAGKQGLLDNMGKLMEFAGHQKLMAHRYVEATIRDTARQLHAPKGLSGPELVEWTRRVSVARGVEQDNAVILQQADQLLKQTHSDLPAFVSVARSIYRWKQEILNGRTKHTPGG